MLRRTRIVCISDTHNSSPEHGAFKLPKGDVLIHAGDLTKQGTLAELQKTVSWIEKADFEVKIVVAGNHDITLDPEFYAEYGHHFHNQNSQVPKECISLLRESSSITYLENEAVDVRLCKEGGPRTKFRVFGSPLSPRLRTWAFQYDPEDATKIWDRIPMDTDIVVSHTPPRYHCDQLDKNQGCEALRQALWRVRPSLSICGHIHSARGAERIRWDLSNANVRFKELKVGHWDDAAVGTKKQALLDLSSRSAEPLENDGSHTSRVDLEMTDQEEAVLPTHGTAHVVPVPITTTSTSPARGQGGDQESGRCDAEALQGRLGRCETCVINASIMASSYPYKGSGAERYNKPVVVDIDLPTWDL